MLSQQQIHNPDYPIAAGELLDNIRLLIVAGFFEEALALLNLVFTDGPWQAKRIGNTTESAQQLLPLLWWLNRRPSPATTEGKTLTVEQLDIWAQRNAKSALYDVMLQARQMQTPAGANWTEPYLQTIIDGAPSAPQGKDLLWFEVETEVLLKARLQKALGAKPAKPQGLPPAFLAKLQSEMGEEALAEFQKNMPGNQVPSVADFAMQLPLELLAQVVLALPAGKQSHYLREFNLLALLLLCLQDGQADLALPISLRLVNAKGGCAGLMRVACHQPLADWFRSRRVGEALGIDAAVIQAYAAAVATRAMPEPVVKTVRDIAPSVTRDLPALLAALAGTALAKLDYVTCPVPDSDEVAFAALLPANEADALWQEARQLLEKTGRWPLITTDWGAMNDWREDFVDGDVFSRNAYKQVAEADDISPHGLICTADTVDTAGFLSEGFKQYDEALPAGGPENLDKTAERCGSRPSAAELGSAQVNGQPVTTYKQLERWLLDWESAHGWQGEPTQEPVDHLANQPKILVFMPTASSWDCLAYMHWWGAYSGTEKIIAVGRQWEKNYGAELSANYGTLLHCEVSCPPENFDAAFELAKAHLVVAPCTLILSGIDERDYARDLMHWHRWILHERP